jgi:hypothetical protein
VVRKVEHPVRTYQGVKREADKHIVDPVKKHVIRPIEREAAEGAKELKTSLRAVRREVANESGRVSREIERAVPAIERRIEHDLALLDKDVLKHLPSARAIAQWTGTLSSFAAVAGLVLPPPADAVAEAMALGLAEVSITASAVDAIKHPHDPGRTVDALVQIGLARLGVSGPAEQKAARATGALIGQLYYDFLRKGH